MIESKVERELSVTSESRTIENERKMTGLNGQEQTIIDKNRQDRNS